MGTNRAFQKAAVGIMTTFNPRTSDDRSNGDSTEKGHSGGPPAVNSREATGKACNHAVNPYSQAPRRQLDSTSSFLVPAVPTSVQVNLCTASKCPGLREHTLPRAPVSSCTSPNRRNANRQHACLYPERCCPAGHWLGFLNHTNGVPGVGTVVGAMVVRVRRPASPTRPVPRTTTVHEPYLGGSRVSGTC